jgi:dTDP-4-dehydrorhamnose reductase
MLVIGSKGQLGWELTTRAEDWGFDAVGYDLPELDITAPDAVGDVVDQSEASIVVNAAAYTAVDKAEEEREQAYAVNCRGVSYLAKACREVAIPLVHISTDYVFDGESDLPYRETDPISPLGVYGHSKAAGEAEVQRILEEHIIVRTSWLCGFQGKNFVKTVLRLGKERDEIRVVDDQYGCPTFAADLAGAIFQTISALGKRSRPSWGVYHCCGRGIATWYGFAAKILEVAAEYESFPARVVPISTEEFPTPASRPAYSVLDCSRMQNEFGVQIRPWQEGLSELLERLFKQGSISARHPK